MKAVRLHELGGPEKLLVEDVPDLVPGAGEIAVRITRAAFNRRDVFITQGLYPGITLPKTLGSDGCGAVAALGEGVSGPAVGTPVVINPCLGWGDDPNVWRRDASVLGMPHDGTFAELCVVPAENVFAKPAHLSDDEAAALPLGGLTAYRALCTRGSVSAEDSLLITGIGGGVQTYVLLFAKQIGVQRIVVTSSSDEKLERAKALGADAGINYASDKDWHKTARKAAGGDGPTLIVDSAGGDTFAKCLDIAAYGARVVTYGGTNGEATIRPFSVFWKMLDVLGTSMGSPQDFKSMLRLVERGGVRPVVDGVVPMNDVVSAAQRIAEGKQFGNVVLAIA